MVFLKELKISSLGIKAKSYPYEGLPLCTIKVLIFCNTYLLFLKFFKFLYGIIRLNLPMFLLKDTLLCKTWNGLDWIGLDWNGMDWYGMEWNGMDWIGMDWTGLDWNGLDWNGIKDRQIYYIFLYQNVPFKS